LLYETLLVNTWLKEMTYIHTITQCF
jgi:hypothetical protein